MLYTGTYPTVYIFFQNIAQFKNQVIKHDSYLPVAAHSIQAYGKTKGVFKEPYILFNHIGSLEFLNVKYVQYLQIVHHEARKHRGAW